MTLALSKSSALQRLMRLPLSRSQSDRAVYDLAVIGGGSGGLAAAQKAYSYGARVAVFDYVHPSTQGSRWGLGGTCVNVGCIPKKLMHHAAMYRKETQDSAAFGWSAKGSTAPESGESHEENLPIQHDWLALVQNVQNHIKSLNFQYRTQLQTKGIDLHTRAPAHVLPRKDSSEPWMIECGSMAPVAAKNILISTGGRPNIPSDIPGALEFGITSDDLFSRRITPGRTLCVGASYISLECAGILHGLGYPVHVAVRSKVLRGFDRQCADFVAQLMDEEGIDFLWQTVPQKIEKTASGSLLVTLNEKNPESNNGSKVKQIEFDTVLFATGRNPDLRAVKNLSPNSALNSQLKLNPETGRLDVDVWGQTSLPNLFAVGDVAHGFPELTPVAIRQGEILADKLFGPAGNAAPLQNENIPTTIFTPVEYGCIGLSEEAAYQKYGQDDIEVFLSQFSGLQQQAAHRKKPVNRRAGEWDVDATPSSLAKLVCLKSQGNRVVGFHYVGPNAGEITQGFALALQLGATKKDFDALMPIHPIDAEAFAQLSVTRSSGLSFLAKGGCGGGKCG